MKYHRTYLNRSTAGKQTILAVKYPTLASASRSANGRAGDILRVVDSSSGTDSRERIERRHLVTDMIPESVCSTFWDLFPTVSSEKYDIPVGNKVMPAGNEGIVV
jgi:hypothetical protein